MQGASLQLRSELHEAAALEAARLEAMEHEVREIDRSKASHIELCDLLTKLQHRPKPGQLAGVQPLLSVPYPMPPGSTSPRSRPCKHVAAPCGGLASDRESKEKE